MNYNLKNKISSKIIYLRVLPILILLAPLIFGLNKLFPATKQEMIYIAQTHHCPLRLNLSYGDDVITFYDYCIRILEDGFTALSDSDRKDVVINFIIYGNLDAGSSEEFIELIRPYRETIFKSLDNISNAEIQGKFMLSKSAIVDYNNSINHYRKAVGWAMPTDQSQPKQ
jgi:hypothetical protein